MSAQVICCATAHAAAHALPPPAPPAALGGPTESNTALALPLPAGVCTVIGPDGVCLPGAGDIAHAIVPATAFPLAVLPATPPTLPLPLPLPVAAVSAAWVLGAALAGAGIASVVVLLVIARQTRAANAPAAASAPAEAEVAAPAAPPSVAEREVARPGRGKRARFERVGKLDVDTRTLLGHGSHGTLVFKVAPHPRR